MAATYTVSNNSDSGAGSFRQALIDANANAGADIVNFSGGPFLIAPISVLPTLSEAVTIQGDNSVVNGTSSGASYGLLVNNAGPVIIQNLGITAYTSGAGIVFQTGTGHVVTGSRFGTDFSDNTGMGNQLGIYIDLTFTGTLTIGGTGGSEGNVISGNSYAGILHEGSGTINIYQNKIGVNSAGAAAMSNGDGGILVFNTGGTTTIGGDSASYRNVISGHSGSGSGIVVNSTTAGAVTNIRGNYLGTNAAGTAAIPNNWGISLDSSNQGTVAIGSTTAGHGNLISGNTTANVFIQGLGNVTLHANIVGLNATGVAALGTTAIGLDIKPSSGTPTITVGSGTAAGRNVISGHTSGGGSEGVLVEGAAGSVIIQGNYIGTNLLGTAAVANRRGVYVTSANLSAITVGGTTALHGNLISGNTTQGVSIEGRGTLTFRFNQVGLNAAGTATIPNLDYGVGISPGGPLTVDISDNTVSGHTSGSQVGMIVAALSTSATMNVLRNKFGANGTNTGSLTSSLGLLVSSLNVAPITLGSGAASGNVFRGHSANFASSLALRLEGAGNISMLGNQFMQNNSDLLMFIDGATNASASAPLLTQVDWVNTTTVSISGTVGGAGTLHWYRVDDTGSGFTPHPGGRGGAVELLATQAVVASGSFVSPNLTTTAGSFIAATYTTATNQTSQFSNNVMRPLAQSLDLSDSLGLDVDELTSSTFTMNWTYNGRTNVPILDQLVSLGTSFGAADILSDFSVGTVASSYTHGTLFNPYDQVYGSIKVKNSLDQVAFQVASDGAVIDLPIDAAISYFNGATFSTSVGLSLTVGSSYSGISTAKIQRREGTLSLNACSGYGAYVDVDSINPFLGTYNDETVVGSKCYQYAYAITNNNNATLTASSVAEIKNDDVPPTGGLLTYPSGLVSGTSVSITISQGADAHTSIASVQLQRFSAPYSGVCGGFGSAVSVGSQTPGQTLFSDTGVLSNNCYRYQYLVTDAAGNQSVITSSTETIFLATGPNGGTVTYSTSYISASSHTVLVNEGTSADGIQSVQLKRREATLSGGSCGGFGGYTNISTQTVGTTSVLDNTIQTGKCYEYRYTVTDNALVTVDFDGTGSLKVDQAASAGGSVSYISGGVTTSPLTIIYSEGTAASAISAIQLERAEATMSGGVCGGYGAFADIGTQSVGSSNYPDSSIVSGFCYKYQLRVQTGAGTVSYFTSTNEAKVSLGGPTGGSVTYLNGAISTSSYLVNFNEGTSAPGINSVQLQRASATLTSGVCGGFAVFSNIGSQSPGATSFNDTTLGTGNCYRYQYRVTDNLAVTTTYTNPNQLKVDLAAPAGGSVSHVNGSHTSTSLLVSLAAGTAASGIGSVQLRRREATLTAGVCGGYGGFADVGTQSPGDGSFNDTLVGDRCYQYEYRVTGNSGLTATFASGSTTEVVTDGPIGGAVSYVNGFSAVTPVNVGLAAGTSPSGIATVQLRRSEATMTGGVCGGFSAMASVGTQAPADGTFLDSTVTSGRCYQYEYRVTDTALHTVTWTSPNILKLDTVAPSGGSISYPNTILATLPIGITFAQGTASSGIASVQLERQAATLTGGVCGSYGSFTAVGTQSPGATSYNDSSAANESCYKFRYKSTSASGLQTIFTSTDETKLSIPGPSGGSLSYPDAAIGSTTQLISLNEGIAPAGMVAVQLERASATFASNLCGSFGGFGAVGSQSLGAVGYNDSSLVSGNCYKYRYRVQDTLSNVVYYSSSSVLRGDAVGPVGGSVSYFDGDHTSGTHSVSLGAGTAISTIASVQLQRATASLSAGVCGGFSGFSNVGSQSTGDLIFVDTVSDATCYKYQYRVTSVSGLISTWTSLSVIKIILNGPTGGSISYTNGYVTTSPLALALNAGSAPSGLAASQVERAEATLSGGVCGSYGAWTSVGTQVPGDGVYNDSSIVHGKCYRYRYRVTDVATNVVTFTTGDVAKVELSAPSGGGVSYTNGDVGILPLTVTLAPGSAVSGLVSSQLERQEATLTTGTCGSYGGFTAVGVQSPGDGTYLDSSLSSGKCYRYRYSVTSTAGLSATFPSVAVAKVNVAGPSGGSISYANGFYSGSAILVSLNEGTSSSGMASVQLRRASASLSDGVCGGFGGFSNLGSQSPGASTYNDTSIATGFCYKYEYFVQDNGALSLTYTSAQVARVDRTAPSGGSLTYLDGDSTTANQLILFSPGTAASGILSQQLERAEAPLSLGVCGSFGVFAPLGTQTPATTSYLETMVDDFCYQYRLQVQSAVGLANTVTSAAVTKVVLDGPIGGYIVYTDSVQTGSSVSLVLSQGVSPSGVQSVQVERAEAVYANAVCGAFAGFGPVGSQSVGATSFVDNTLNTGQCYRFRYRVQDNGGNVVTYTSPSTIRVDGVAPTGQTISYLDGSTSSLPIVINFNQGTAASGISSVQIERSQAVLTDEVCGGFGGFAPIGSQVTGSSSYNDNTASSGNCYRYRVQSTSGVGLSATQGSAFIAKVTLVGPQGGSVAYVNGLFTGSSLGITLNQGTSSAGITAVQLERAQALFSSGVCGGFGGFSAVGTQSLGATSYSDTSITSGACYRYQYRVTDSNSDVGIWSSANTVRVDNQAPLGGAISYTNGTVSTVPVVLTLVPGSAASGISAVQVERAQATLSGGTCGGFGAFGLLGSQSAGDLSFLDETAQDGMCYQYRYKVDSAAGLSATFTSAAVAKVQLSGPQGGSLSYLNGVSSNLGQLISLNQGISSASITAVQLERAVANLEDGTCASFGPMSPVGSQSAGASSYTDNSLISGNCYKYQYRVTDGAGFSNTFVSLSVMKIDSMPPSGGSLSYPDGPVSTLPIAVSFNEGTAASGIASITLERADAALSAGTCGAFSGFVQAGNPQVGDAGYLDAAIANQTCVKYRFTILTASGQSTVITSPAVAKLSVEGPQGGSISYASGFRTSASLPLSLNQGNSSAGVVSVQVERSEANLMAGSCSSFGPYVSLGSQSPGTGFYTDNSLLSGRCYRYQYRVTDAASKTSVFSSLGVVMVDLNPPSGGSISWPSGNLGNAPILVSLNEGTAASGIGQVQLLRSTGNLSGGNCSAYGAFSPIGALVPTSTGFSDFALSSGSCYKYRYQVQSEAGLVSLLDGSGEVKFFAQGAQGGSIAYADGLSTANSLLITYAQGSSQPAVTAIQVEKSQAIFSQGICGGFGAFAAFGSQALGSTSTTDNGLASGFCYRYRLKVTDGAGLINYFTSLATTKVDIGPPSGGNLTVQDGEVSSLPIIVGLNAGTAPSGLVRVQLQRAEAVLTGSSCGAMGAFVGLADLSPMDTNYADSLTAPSKCFSYRLVVTGGNGLESIYDSPAVAKVGATGSFGGFVDYPNGFVSTLPLSVAFSPGQSQAGLASQQLERSLGTLQDGECSSFSAFTLLSSPSIGPGSFQDTTIESGQCAQYRLKVTDAVAKVTTYTSLKTAKVDTQIPFNLGLSYLDGVITALPLLISLQAGEAASGLETIRLMRAEAALAVGTCGSFGNYNQLAILDEDQTTFQDSDLSNGKCVKYKLEVTSKVGLVGTLSPVAIGKITVVGPQGGHLTYQGGLSSFTSLGLAFNAGTSDDGISAIQLERQESRLREGWCAPFGAYAALGTQSPGNTSYSDTALVSGSCYRYRLKVTDGANRSAYFGPGAVLQVDTQAPTAAMLAYTDGLVGSLPLRVYFSTGWSASGIEELVLRRADAPMTGSVCGGFGPYLEIGKPPVGAKYWPDNSVQNNFCYRYELSLKSKVGLSNLIGSTAVSKVQVRGPHLGGISILGNGFFTANGSVTLGLNQGFSPDGAVTSLGVKRAIAPLQNGKCGAFGGYLDVAAPAIGTTQLVDQVPTGLCARYRLRVTDALGFSTQFETPQTVGVDSANPSVTLTNPGESQPGPVVLNFTIGEIPSGISKLQVLRQEALQTGNSCGAFVPPIPIATLDNGAKKFVDNGVQTGRCYQYHLSLMTGAGKLAVSLPGPEVKITNPGLSGGYLDYPQKGIASTGVSLEFRPGAGPSGLTSAEIHRASAPLSNGACGSFSSFAALPVLVAASQTSFTDSTLQSGQCYQYQYRVRDGNNATTAYETGNSIWVDTAAPLFPTLGGPSGELNLLPVNLSFSSGLAASGISAQYLERAEAILSGQSCGAFSDFVLQGRYEGNSVGTQDLSLSSGRCYRYRLSNESGTGLKTLGPVTLDIRVVLVGPQGASITYPDGFIDQNKATLVFNPGAGPSPIAEVQVLRRVGQLSAGTCNSLGSYSAVGTQTPIQTQFEDTTLTHGKCYQYTLQVKDSQGIQVLTEGIGLMGVDLVSPSASLSYLSGSVGDRVFVSLNVSTIVSGLQKFRLLRATAPRTTGACGTFSNFSLLVDLDPKAISFQDTQLADKTCYKYQAEITTGTGKSLVVSSNATSFTPAEGDPPPATNTCEFNCVSLSLERPSVPKGSAPDPLTLGLLVDIQVSGSSILKNFGVPIVQNNPSFEVDVTKIPQGETQAKVLLTNPPAGFLSKGGAVQCGTINLPISPGLQVVCKLYLPSEGGDTNGDSKVDIKDFGKLKQQFNQQAAEADFNGDGVVNLKDFGLLKQFFGTEANP